MTFGCDLCCDICLCLLVGIGDWDRGLELGIGIGDWDWGLGLEIGYDFWF